MKIYENADVVLKPGVSLNILRADGMACVRIGGESMVIHKVGRSPAVW